MPPRSRDCQKTDVVVMTDQDDDVGFISLYQFAESLVVSGIDGADPEMFEIIVKQVSKINRGEAMHRKYILIW